MIGHLKAHSSLIKKNLVWKNFNLHFWLIFHEKSFLCQLYITNWFHRILINSFLKNNLILFQNLRFAIVSPLFLQCTAATCRATYKHRVVENLIIARNQITLSKQQSAVTRAYQHRTQSIGRKIFATEVYGWSRVGTAFTPIVCA